MFCCICDVYLESWNAYYGGYFEYYGYKIKLEDHSFSCFILQILNEITVHSEMNKNTNAG